jgi:hypothetical protein
MRFAIFGFCLSLILAVGCQKKTEPPVAPPSEPGKGIEIEAPGVDVKVGGGEGVDVKTPGADVEVKKEEPQAEEPKADEPK